jgi:signal transduction histidine kinase
VAGRLGLPLHAAGFWFAQAGVVAIAALHEIVLDLVHARELAWGIPTPLTSYLLLIPVVYAALRFGARAAITTVVTATVLVLPHWVIVHGHPLTESHLWIELLNVTILVVVATAVGRVVDNERTARARTEDALLQASAAEERYRGLFEGQPAPVLIADSEGLVHEVNPAAHRLLGTEVVGQPFEAVLGVSVDELALADTPIQLQDGEGVGRLLSPTVDAVVDSQGQVLHQIVLTDVTDHFRREEEQRSFSTRLLAVQEDERLRLARELHDDPLQQFMFLSRTFVELAEHPELNDVLFRRARLGQAVAEQASGALRELIQGLRPPVLDDLGLVPALRQLVEQTEHRFNVTIDLVVGGSERRLDADLELIAYRVVQESLSNVVRHAHASRADVQVDFGCPLRITVCDNGRGFSGPRRRIAGEVDRGGGLGIAGMRERLSDRGGTLELGANLGGGTVVRASVPSSK